MIGRIRNLVVALLVLLTLGGCAGFRGGWESLPYIGPAAPTALPEALQGTSVRPPLELPGLKLDIALDNRLRTYDTQVYFFVLPLTGDLRDTFDKNNDPRKTRLFVSVTPSDPGVVFRPSQAVLSVGNQRYASAAAFESGRWNSEGQRVTTGGTWQQRPVGPELVLPESGRRYFLSIDFETPPPAPESADIAVDLSRALQVPGRPAIRLFALHQYGGSRDTPEKSSAADFRMPATGKPTPATRIHRGP